MIGLPVVVDDGVLDAVGNDIDDDLGLCFRQWNVSRS